MNSTGNRTSAPYAVLGRIALIAVAIALAMFRSTKEFTYQREISAPPESVLTILQDPYRLASHSPVFESIVPDEASIQSEGTMGSEVEGAAGQKRLSRSEWYRITDRVPVLGSLQTSITVRVKIMPVEDGVETEVQAGFGTTLKARYTVELKGDGSCILTEVAVVDSLSAAMPFVLSTFKAGHLASFESIVNEAERNAAQSFMGLMQV